MVWYVICMTAGKSMRVYLSASVCLVELGPKRDDSKTLRNQGPDVAIQSRRTFARGEIDVCKLLHYIPQQKKPDSLQFLIAQRFPINECSLRLLYRREGAVVPGLYRGRTEPVPRLLFPVRLLKRSLGIRQGMLVGDTTVGSTPIQPRAAACWSRSSFSPHPPRR